MADIMTKFGFLALQNRIRYYENLRTYSGEAIINENGVIISFSVYYNQNINFDKKKINQLEYFIKKIAKDNKKTILIF